MLACPLTGDPHVKVLEEIPTSLLSDIYRRDLNIDIISEFQGIESLSLCRSIRSDVIFFSPAIVGSSRFYQALRTFDWYYPSDKFEYDRAASWIRPGDHVLDIGCGSGYFSKYLTDVTYTGLEPEFLSSGLTSHPPLNIVAEEVTEHALTHHTAYDAVCAFQVLEHMPDPRSFISAALTCLKPGGLLILGVPSAESYVSQLINFTLNTPPHHVTWWTDQALWTVASQFSLELLSLEHAPVESWEQRLYWMQRIATTLMPTSAKRFNTMISQRLVNIAAYLTAGILTLTHSPPVSAQGASVVFIARKMG